MVYIPFAVIFPAWLQSPGNSSNISFPSLRHSRKLSSPSVGSATTRAPSSPASEQHPQAYRSPGGGGRAKIEGEKQRAAPSCKSPPSSCYSFPATCQRAMACYPGQPGTDDQGEPLSDSELDYVQQSLHSTQVIVRWLENNYHYEEGICLPRSTIYEHYLDFCQRDHLHPINAASFGKIIRQQFSSLTTRRLGTRGKSKYHYFGLGIKPTSLYYNEEYFKRHKEGMSRKEPDSKKAHPVYPKENPSAVLPPFPDANTLNLSQSVSKDKLTTFMVMYRTHCQRILDSVARANFSEVENFLLHFWQAMPRHLLPVLASSVVVDLVALCDTQLYSVISAVLIISPVQSFPESLLQEVLKFCSQLGHWLDHATSGLPDSIRHIKQQTAKTFVKTLKRQIAIMELAKATRKALQREDQLTQLHRDWEGLDMHAVLAQVLYAMQPLDLPHSALHVVPELLNQFVCLLEDKTSVEDFVVWGQKILNMCVKPCAEGKKGVLQLSRVFILTWKLFTAKISREITLQNAPSFGTFHLIHMLMDDYLLHLLETRLERQQLRDFEKKITALRDEDVAVSGFGVEDQLPPSTEPVLPLPQQQQQQQQQQRNSPSLINTITLPDGSSHGGRISPFEMLTTQLDSPTSSATPISPLHPSGPDLHATGRPGAGVGVGGGGGGGSRSLPESPLLEPGMMVRNSVSPSTTTQRPPSHNIRQMAVSTPTSTAPTMSLSLAMSALPPSHPPSLPPSHLPPSLGSTAPLSAFPVLSQALPPPLSLSSASMPSQPPLLPTNPLHPLPPSSSNAAGMSQFMQGLQNALNPHQSTTNPFSNPLTVTPFTNPLTSMAAPLGNPPPSLPLLPTMYSYGPYGGVGGVPVVPSGPVGVGVVGGGPVSCSGGPGVIPTPSFPAHSLMPAYSSYIPPAMYPSHQINSTPSST